MNDISDVPTELAALIVSPTAYAKQKRLLAGFKWLRANNPVGRVEVNGFEPFWAVTRRADIADISRQHNLFHNGDRSAALVPQAADDMARERTGGSPHLMRALLQMDAPDHAKYRSITQAWFTMQKVASFANRIRAIARQFVDGMAARGDACDFVCDIALHYPLHVVMAILGIPREDEPHILKLTQDLFRSQDADVRLGSANRDPARHAKRLDEAFTGFQSYFAPLMEARRRIPQDDLATIIANAQIDGKPISHFEAISYYMLLAIAGHHTTASATSGAIWALCENPGELRKVKADPRLVSSLVEEAVRWTTPVQHAMRTATSETEIQGRQIAKYDWLMLCNISGNRDERAFEQPDRFCIAKRLSRNVAFGYGAHACLGQHLARLEMQIFFEELLPRLRSIEIAGKPRRSASLYLGGPLTLPVRFKMDGTGEPFSRTGKLLS